ncbi:MAG: sulfite exporter TauE/SafE family protein [Cytophagaceae bacterium]
MEFFGYGLAILIGLSLGLIGGGGSILTVPVLVYVMHMNPVISTAYSLFIVGATALAGAYTYFRQKQLCYRAAIVFSIPSFLAVFFTRSYLMPMIPDHIGSIGEFMLTKQFMIMFVFALLMILSSYSMISKGFVAKISDEEFSPGKIKFNYPLIILEGAVVGMLTGFVGAGGGFLIIPALVLLVGLPMKVSIGTSLLIIAAKSLLGFTGDVYAGLDVDWGFLLLFTGFALGGIGFGTYFSKKVKSEKLKPAFGWFTLILGIMIMIKELI